MQGEAKPITCKPTATLYPVGSGMPDVEHPLEFPVYPEKDLLDINKATKEELMGLPGIGNAEAVRIITLRRYSKKEELLSKAGIPWATYDKIKDQIVVK